MLVRYRGLILTVVIAVLGTTAIAIFCYPAPTLLDDLQYEDARRSQYYAGGEACQPSAIEAIRDWGERLRKREACAKEAEDYRLQTNDLIQQTRAASAAEAQASIAAQGLWLAFLQTIGGYLTLVAAGAAAIYARAAAIHTEGSVKVTRDVGQAQVRAYLRIESPRLYIAWFSGRLVPYIQCRFENSGASPAYHARMSYKIAFAYHEAGEEAVMASEARGHLEAEPKSAGIHVQANGGRDFPPYGVIQAALTNSEIGAFQRGDLHVFLEVRTYFTDVFDQEIPGTYLYNSKLESRRMGPDHSIELSDFTSMRPDDLRTAVANGAIGFGR